MNEKWKQLLNPETFRQRSDIKTFDGRNPFENDYGRLISSAPIRRLQDKTQVFPLEKSDYIRTRLTHSLEVSYIASSIGKSIERYLFDEKGLSEKEYSGHISSVLRCAGLVHDLGNPPYGHFGETAIQEFFKKYFKDNKKTCSLSKREKRDFKNFDGNVQTFRILRKLSYLGDEYSYNLTFPTIASIIKYPSTSVNGNKGKNATRIAEKKYGYFITEQEDYDKINDTLGLNNNRHPLVYLLEAADDIAYSAADIEDGAKLGIIGYEKIKDIFKTNLVENKYLLEKLDEIYEKNKGTLDRLSLTVQQFRILTQGKMIEGVINCFKENYEEIMKGEFEYELLDKSSGSDIRKSYKKLQYIVFDNKNIIQTELAGGEILTGLLEIFIKAAEKDSFKTQGNDRETRLYKNISSSYRYIYENLNNHPNEEYKRIQLITDFISGMTDTYALNLYRKLKGIRL